MPETHLFGVAHSLGSPAHLEKAPIQSVAKARICVREQAAACLDEMGQREKLDLTSLATAVIAWVTVRVVRTSRRATVAQGLLVLQW